MARKYTPAESCDCEVIHEEVVHKVKQGMPEEEILMNCESIQGVGDLTV